MIREGRGSMTPKQFVDTLRRHERFLRGLIGGVRANLNGANLSGLRLPRINLQHAILNGTDFTDCQLPGANFSFADLGGACFNGAKSPGADFTRAELRQAKMRHANMPATNFREAAMSGADLHGGDFARCDFQGSRLSNADISAANLQGANVANAHLDGANLRGAMLADVDLNRADLRDAIISRGVCDEAAKLGITITEEMEKSFFNVTKAGYKSSLVSQSIFTKDQVGQQVVIPTSTWSIVRSSVAWSISTVLGIADNLTYQHALAALALPGRPDINNPNNVIPTQNFLTI